MKYTAGKFIHLCVSQPFLMAMLLIVSFAICILCGDVPDRVHCARTDLDLQLGLGKRVVVCGKYECLGPNSPFDLLRFGRNNVPIALPRRYANGFPLPKIPDGAQISIRGRLVDPPPYVSLQISGKGSRHRQWTIQELRHPETDIRTFEFWAFSLEVEDIQLSSELYYPGGQ